jgi:hypothetical protein
MISRKRYKVNKTVNEKIIIFENAERPDICYKSTQQPEFPAFLRPALFNSNSCKIIQNGYAKKQEQETPVPPGIKHITGNEQKGILYLKLPVYNEPVDDKNYRQKNKKFN